MPVSRRNEAGERLGGEARPTMQPDAHAALSYHRATDLDLSLRVGEPIRNIRL